MDKLYCTMVPVIAALSNSLTVLSKPHTIIYSLHFRLKWCRDNTVPWICQSHLLFSINPAVFYNHCGKLLQSPRLFTALVIEICLLSPSKMCKIIFKLLHQQQLWPEASCFLVAHPSIWLFRLPSECDISRTPVGNFIKFCTNVRLDSRMNY